MSPAHTSWPTSCTEPHPCSCSLCIASFPGSLPTFFFAHITISGVKKSWAESLGTRLVYVYPLVIPGPGTEAGLYIGYTDALLTVQSTIQVISREWWCFHPPQCPLWRRLDPARRAVLASAEDCHWHCHCLQEVGRGLVGGVWWEGLRHSSQSLYAFVPYLWSVW